MQHKCYTFQMSDRIVSLQYGNCCGPSSLEACLNGFSLYRLQCWILASRCCFEGPLQPNIRLFWGKNTGETDRQAKMKWSELLTVLEWSLWADPVNATMWCACISMCVSVGLPDGHSLLSRTHKECGILIFSSYQKNSHITECMPWPLTICDQCFL